ncbi:ABC transporter substrate-binding protein [Georgenia ruanii]|uniref:Extracellular solute-binding protein n=1 Tax=Georgenia ruanii TaxID=348442 RepID=A0A7J9V0T3_9MICO|nr:extracellular solute-binding protein [Georgenia ruanii]MPV90488.1 extracellular solute-binding protein [Georgenia ruanii]
MRMRNVAGTVTVAIAVAMSAAACGGSDSTSELVVGGWNAIVEAAEKEGKVTIYGSQGDTQLADLKERFEAEYDIDVDVVRGGDGDLAAKVDAEAQTGRGAADLWFAASDPMIIAADDKGYFVSPVGPAFEADEVAWDVISPKGTYFTSNSGVLTIGWNVNELPEGMTDYTDFLKPEMKGRFGVIEPLAAAYVDFYLWLEENYGDGFAEELAAQEPKVYTSTLAMAEAVVSGEIAAATFVQPLTSQMEAGAPVDWGIGAKGYWGPALKGGVLSSAPNPNAAQVLANFIVTRGGQEALGRDGGSILPDIEGAVGSAAEARISDNEILTPEKVSVFQDDWRRSFQ